MRYLVIVALLSAVFSSSANAGGPRAVNGVGQPMKWSTAGPVVYNPDQGTLGTLSNAEARALVAEAFAVWEAGPAAITFSEGALLPQDVNAAGIPFTNPAHFQHFYREPADGLAPVIFDTDGSIIDARFGEGARFELLGIAGVDTPVGAVTQITESSIIINGAFFDGVGLPSSPPDVTREALKAAIVHEIGHFMNLDHTVLNHELALDGNPGNDIYVPTMFPIAVTDEEALASTNPDDELAALNLYPTGAPANSISGSVTSAGLRFQGANVVFRKTDDPLMTSYALISGGLYFPCNPPGTCTLGDPPVKGAFAADYFAPGQYRVCVEQIDRRFATTSAAFVGPLATPPILSGPEECFDLSEGSSQSDDPDDVSPVTAGSGTPVNIVLNDLPSADPFEPNNSFATGTTLADLPTGQDTVGAVLGAGDLDVYLVPVVAGQRVRIDVDAEELGSSLDAVVGFYNASNVLVARVDDAPDPDTSEFSFDPALTLIASFTGTAKIVVSAFPDLDQDGVGGGTTGPYWLRVEVAADTDGDGVPDSEDICPTTAKDDADRDGVCFGADNCPTQSNPTQDAPVKISGAMQANGDVSFFAVTPDDARVIFVGDRDNDEVFELYSVPVGGGAITKLNTDFGATAKDVTDFRLSSDGARVVYRADQDIDEQFELYSVPTAGGTVTKVSGTMAVGGDIVEFGISPNGAKVVFRADQDTDGVFELYSVPIAGGTVTKLSGTMVAGGNLPDPGPGFSSFVFSPDSTTIAYHADQETDEKFEIFTVPIGGGTPVKLNGTLIAAGDVRNLQIDSLSTRVVYAADQDQDEVIELYSVPLTGGVATKLNTALPVGRTGWQRNRITQDGSTVVYVMDQSLPTVFELYSVPITGGANTKLSGTLVSGGDVFGIALPVGPSDGNRMTFRADKDTDGRVELYSVPTSGGTVVKLNAALPAGGNVTAQGGGIYGSTVVYVADQATDEQFEVFSVPAAGGTPVKISGTMVAGGDYQAAGFDARRIAVIADKDADEVFELYGTRLAGGLPVKLSGSMASGGDVIGWWLSTADNPGFVVYHADQDTDETFELYSRIFSLDTDGDGVFDRCDICLAASDPGQTDADGNGVGDACQSCSVGNDPDADGVCGLSDNCPAVANANQADFDTDGAGDACDADDDNDGLSDAVEAQLGTNPLDADTDDDGVNDGNEVAAGSDPNSPSFTGSSSIFGSRRTVSNSEADPLSIVTADIDGDGDQDVLSANYTAGVVAWYENNGLSVPTWTERVVTATAPGVQSVAAADFDGDGDVDVVMGNVSDVRWYESNGAALPVWTERTISSSAASYSSVVAADMDGDGDLDVLFTSYTDNKVAWFANNGAAPPVWTEHLISSAGSTPFTVAAADVDGDGDMDVLSADFGIDTIAWYESDGGTTPTWTRRVVSNTADGARFVVTADVDRDGNLDVVAASADDDTVAWYRNNGAQPPVWTKHVITTNADFVEAVFAADVDGDGDVDVLSASPNDGTIRWLESNGASTPSFAEHVVNASSSGASSVVAADVDGDGDLDVLAASNGDETVAWYENLTIHRNATFPAQSLIAASLGGVVSAEVGDIDGDGDLDVVHAAGQGDTIKWFASDGANPPAWTSARTIGTTASGLERAHLVDLDGDGDLDVLSAASVGDAVQWFESSGGAVPTWTLRTISISQDGPLDVAAADLDGDGDLDVVASSQNDRKVVWYRNDGAHPPAFTEFLISVSGGSAFRRGLAIADLDHDGDMDVVAAVPNLGVHWYANDGAATPGWTERVISDAFGLTTFVDVADIDGDGDLDVTATEYTGTRVGWFENNGAANPSFALRAIATGSNHWSEVHARDMDHDGDVDLVVTAGSDAFAWFVNDGNNPPAFTMRAIATGGESIGAFAPADLDGDGDVDLAVGEYIEAFGHRCRWWENRGGQFKLTTTSLAPASIGNGATVALMAVDLTSNARPGDADVELATLELLITNGSGASLSSAAANALIERIRVYQDDGSSTFQLGSDTLVTTVEDLALSPLVVPFAEGDPRMRVAAGQTKRYFVVVEATADASTKSPNNFFLRHGTAGLSKARDAASGAFLRNEYAPGVSTAMISTIGDVVSPVVTGVYPAAGAVDVDAHTNVVVFVSEPVDPATADLGVTLSAGGVKVAGTVTVSDDGRTISIDPHATLALGGHFQLQVTNALLDRAGNRAVPFVSSFSATSNPSSGIIDPDTLGDAGGGSVLEGANVDDNSGFSAAALGDVNLPAASHGISDLIIGAPNTDVSGAVDAGEAKLIFGGPGLQSSSGTVVSVLYRTGTAMDFIGETVARAGDMNHDGIQDFLIGAPHSAQSPSGAGVVYLVFGSTGIPGLAPGPLNLNDLAACSVPSLCGVKFLGQASGDNAGASLSYAGDVNADGFDDLLIGAPNADPAGRTGAGVVYLIYGPVGPGTILLSSVGSTTRGLVFRGEAAGDHAGSAVSPWRDRNSDGNDDMLLGAPGAGAINDFGASIPAAGYVYAVHGGTQPGHLVDTATPGVIELTRVASGAVDQVAGMVFIGSEPNKGIGRSVTGEVDTDGNGTSDIIVAGNGIAFAIPGDGPKIVIGNTQTGGRTDSALVRTLGSLNAIDDFHAARFLSGDDDPLVVGPGGDLNHDGFEDIVIGSPQSDGAAGADSGRAYVILGAPVVTDGDRALADVGDTIGGFVMEGAGAGDNLGASVGGGFDLNADGIDDGLVGAPFADSDPGTPTNAGETYVISPLRPEEVVQLTQKSGGVIEWSVVPLSAGYNVYRGSLSTLRAAGVVRTSAMDQVACNYFGDGDANQLPDITDATVPPPGDGLFWLVTARNAHGEGPLGAATPTRVNDTQCP